VSYAAPQNQAVHFAVVVILADLAIVEGVHDLEARHDQH